jgi:hypothetical protein
MSLSRRLSLCLILGAAWIPAFGAAADLPEFNQEYERCAVGIVERCRLKSDVRGDEWAALSRVISVHREMQRRGVGDRFIPIDTLRPLARAYANGVEPMLLARRLLVRTTVRDLVIGDRVTDVPGTSAERLAVAHQLLAGAKRAVEAGGADALDEARELGLGAILLIATDSPMTIGSLAALSNSDRKALTTAGIDVDGIVGECKAYGNVLQSVPGDRVQALADLADQLARSEKPDLKRLQKFSHRLEELWPDLQLDVGMTLAFCHYAYAMRVGAAQAADTDALAELRRLSEVLVENSTSRLNQGWARQIVDLPVVPRKDIELPAVSRTPHDLKGDPP